MQADDKGFLVGQKVAAEGDLDAIRIDVAAIRRVVEGGRVPRRSAAMPSSREVAAEISRQTRQAVSVGRVRDAAGRFVAGRSSQPGATKSATPQNRAEDGRFTGGGRLEAAIDRLSASIDADVQKIDPTIEASKELADVARTVFKPMSRGFAYLTSRNKDKEQVGWLKRIFGALNKRRPDGVPVLPTGADEGGGSSGLLKGAPLSLARALTSRAGMLKKLPFIGSLFAAAGITDELTKSDDPLKTAEQNREERYRGVAGVAGTVGGAWGGMKVGALVGSAFLGPLGGILGAVGGAVAGGLYGEDLGKELGSFAKYMIDADIPGQITKAWKGFTDSAAETWGKVTEQFGKVAEAVIAPLSALNSWVKEKTGIDMASNLSTNWENFKGVAGRAGSAAQSVVYGVGDRIRNTVESATPDIVKRFAAWQYMRGDIPDQGSYTPAEAERIIALKRSRANTSANIGGMPPEIATRITEAAKAAGVDPNLMLRIAAVESGGNVDAVSPTGATGLFQFTGKTASAVGIQNRFDPGQNIAGAMRLTQQNMAALRAKGVPLTMENVYMAHQLGVGAATELIGAANRGARMSDLSESTRSAMALNAGGKTTTSPGAYLDSTRRMLDQRYNSVVPQTAVSAPRIPAVSTGGTAAYEGVRAPSITAPDPMPVNIPASRNESSGITVRMPRPEVGQNVSDREIAHAVTGGLGGS